MNDESVIETLSREFGEEQARRIVEVLFDKSEQIREGRKNCRVMIVFNHPNAAYQANWGKLVTEYTRTSDIDN